jgi:SAM-dependent MidA family methyltransferase
MPPHDRSSRFLDHLARFKKEKIGEKDINLMIQTLFAFPTISNEISSIILVENSDHLQKIQGQKLEARLKGRQVDLSWVDKIEDIPECTSSHLFTTPETDE